jgi:protein-tyrosine phosphatase
MTEALVTTLKILFVCLGGICRAPAAVGTMNFLIAKYNLTGIEVSSCGTEGYHSGELADERMRNAGLELFKSIQEQQYYQNKTLKHMI